jgi:hypothetical protein
MNGARGFTANDFYDARMSVAESVDGDASEKIEIFFAGGVVDVAAAAMSEDEGLALVGGEQELLGIVQARIGSGFPGARFFAETRGVNDSFLFA